MSSLDQTNRCASGAYELRSAQGAPAVSLPAGFGKNGLPLGIQAVGAYRQDYHLLRVAKWIEGVLRFDPGLPKIASAK